MNKIKDASLLASAAFFTIVSTVGAQADITIRPADSSTFPNLVGFQAEGVVSFAVTILFIVAAVVFFIMLLIGGIRWILSAGDKAKTEAARSQITSALIGLVIVFSAYAIVSLINTFFSIDILDLNIPSIR